MEYTSLQFTFFTKRIASAKNWHVSEQKKLNTFYFALTVIYLLPWKKKSFWVLPFAQVNSGELKWKYSDNK